MQRRALIVKLGQIGDVIMAIPAVYALHQKGYEIDWVCGKAVQSLLACYSWINLISVDDRAILLGSYASRARGIIGLWRTLLSRRYDLCATLYYDRRYGLLTFPVRAQRKRMLSFDTRAAMLLPARHHPDEYARFLLELPDDCRDQSCAPVPPDQLPPSPLPARTAPVRIALVPGGAARLVHEQAGNRPPSPALRRWPIHRFVEVAEEAGRRGWEVVLLGGPEEDWIKPHFKHLAIIDCLGTLTLGEVVTALNSCDAIVTNDTGPLHLAGLSAACIVAVFGPTNPFTYLPRRSLSVGIWGGHNFACRPCYNGRDFAPCQFNGCMHQVSSDLVMRELDLLLLHREHGMPTPWRVISPELA